MICVWSGKDTSKDRSREHIIPENVGGKQKLPRGCVSDEYNWQFSADLDKALRFHPAFASSYQIHDHIKGKKRTGRSRQRQGRHPKEYIEKGNFRSICETNQTGEKQISSINPDYLVTDTTFVRALHKCAANILTFKYGVEHVREEYMPLIEFVLTGCNHLQWSYAVCFANPFFPGFSKEFDILNIFVNGRGELICLILHASGIWGMSPKPNGLNLEKLLLLSESLSEVLNRTKINKWLGIKVNSSRQCIGTSCLYWCKPNWPVQVSCPPDENLAFTNCRTCGQILRTGINLGYRLKTQVKEKHGNDKFYRVYLSRAQNPPHLDKFRLICQSCSCDHIYEDKDLYFFDFDRQGMIEI